jgi:hypothetical protein
MVVTNYSDFIILEELKNWEKIYQTLNEGNSWEDLTNKIFGYLEKAAVKGEKFLLKVAYNIFRYFKANPKVLILVMGILTAKYQLSKDQIVAMVPEDTIVSAEELYAQSMDGKGLPEDMIYDSDSEEETTTVKYNKPISGNIRKYLDAIAAKESTNDPEKVNTIGYMGKYQFGEIALKDILQKNPNESDKDYEKRIKSYWPNNFGKVRTEADFNYFQSKFKNKGTDFWPEHKQDLAMKQLLKNNKAYLGDYIDKWVGKKKKGIKITLSGLLAGAHLLGPSNVKDFLDKGKIAKDGYGTPITEYIKKFGGYSVNI